MPVTLIAQGAGADGAMLESLMALAGKAEGGPLSLPLQVLLLMALLTLLPSILLMMTAFARILIVLSILRQALGLQQAPPNQLLVGMALFLTLFVMQPALDEIDRTALRPFVADSLAAEQAIGRAGEVLHRFMMANTRRTDLDMFARMAKAGPFAAPADVPMRVLVPAFITSELKTAFQIGVLVYLPFLVIDLVVAAVLMALGMMMVSPVMIALPFKLMLFVAVDGWALIMASLAGGFAIPAMGG
ncbi:flagellar type III secretion system pore protein FliP [Sandaracinobacteroides sp. A072]|uniref:flagellar type III secretion system pore protein FliP n=1 Tax=Sandaracinobacteroides sp. A072 TaxID=3461146 RepID=UPI00404296D5